MTSFARYLLVIEQARPLLDAVTSEQAASMPVPEEMKHVLWLVECYHGGGRKTKQPAGDLSDNSPMWDRLIEERLEPGILGWRALGLL